MMTLRRGGGRGGGGGGGGAPGGGCPLGALPPATAGSTFSMMTLRRVAGMGGAGAVRVAPVVGFRFVVFLALMSSAPRGRAFAVRTHARSLPRRLRSRRRYDRAWRARTPRCARGTAGRASGAD